MISGRTIKTLAIVFASAALAAAMTGCSSLKVQSLTPEADVPTGELKRLTEKERGHLSKDLVAEIQSIEGDPLELARVFGQVANLGKKSYEEAQFELIVESSDSEGTKVESKRIGTFTLQNVKPGSLQPFEVQSTLRPGDIKKLKVLVYAVR